MATLSTSIPSLTFPQQLDTLEFAGSGSFDLLLTLQEDGGEAKEILDTTLTIGDTNAMVYDLALLLQDWLTTKPATLTISIDGTAAATTTVLPCRTYAPGGATSWCKTHALSLASGQRATTYNSTEYVSVYQTASETFIFSLVIFFPDGTSVTKTLTSSTDSTGCLETVRWKWSDFTDDIPQAYRNKFSATLTAKTNSGVVIAYRYNAVACPYGAQELRYRNAFGQWETLLFAMVTNKHKPTRTSAVINGEYRNYLVENATTYEGVSLALTDGQVAQAADFLEATAIERTSDGAVLALTDGELEEETTATALPRLKATWREVTRTPRPAASSTSIFDESFDESFE